MAPTGGAVPVLPGLGKRPGFASPVPSTRSAFAARLRENPGRAWRPAELVDHAATYGTPRFPPGRGFEYCDTGYVVTGILVEQATGLPLHQVYRELVFDPAGMDSTWLEG
jgi:D-alanyl-D-alanine carboxypeptidase